MKLAKRIYLCLAAIIFILAGCNSKSTENSLQSSKPKDFNFIFYYGVNAKNSLDTFKEEFTKDMITEPSITTKIKLTEEEMSSLYEEMKRINILNYPENFNPIGNSGQKPYNTYIFKITIDDIEKNILWKDQSLSDAEDAAQLREVIKKIQEIIVSKDEYKKLPDPKGGYL